MTAATSQMQHVASRDGQRIAYWKTGSGPPLVLVHGAISDRTTWALVQGPLAERFTVYTMNRRGREGSDSPAQHTLQNEFEDIVAVIEAAGEPVHLFGHSGGALCAMGAALLTQRLRSLILYEPPDVTAVSNHTSMGTAIRHMIGQGNPEQAAMTFLSMGPGVPDEGIELLRQSPAWPQIVALASTLPAELDAIEGWTFDAAKFASLTIPVLLLLGGESYQPQLRNINEALARVLPHAQQREFPGQGHVAHLGAPHLFVDKVVKFLETVE